MTYGKSRNSRVTLMSRLSLETRVTLVSFLSPLAVSAWNTSGSWCSWGSCLIKTRRTHNITHNVFLFTCTNGSTLCYIATGLHVCDKLLACHVCGIPLSPGCPVSPLSPLGPSREIPGSPISPGSPWAPWEPGSPLSPLIPGTPG